MTQQTPHERALGAAADMHEQFGLPNAIQTYLTTLLDSPEMVENIAIELCDDSSRLEQARTCIAAIKKEAGV